MHESRGNISSPIMNKIHAFESAFLILDLKLNCNFVGYLYGLLII